jgi:glutaredoxin
VSIARLAVGAALLACVTSAAAQLYRWTDDNGKVHFADRPPPPGARDVQKKDLAHGAASGGESLPFALQRPMKEFPVTLYSAPNCESCAPARALLNARGVPFKEVSVRTDEEIQQLNQAVGANVVPALLVGSSIVKGFEEGEYQRALDIGGYPKTGELPARHQAEPKPPQTKTAEEKPTAPEPKKGPYYFPER